MTVWSDERTELLQKLWADGRSATQIAVELGIKSRDAVLGKLGRLKRKAGAALRPSGPSPWKDARAVELLTQYHAEGRSVPQIANAINTQLGTAITENAVRNKLLRLGFKRREKAAPLHPGLPRRFSRKKTVTLVPSPAPDEIAEAVIPADTRCTILDLANETCRWPIGDPWKPDFRFCGAHGADFTVGLPYCRAHTQMAYQPASDRRRGGAVHLNF